MQENLAPNALEIAEELDKIYNDSNLKLKSRKFEVSAATTWISNIYERIRNTVDYKDEHLIRRYAIYRILRVYLSSRANAETTAEILIKDLIRGRYVEDEYISDTASAQIESALGKYIKVKKYLNELRDSKHNAALWEFMLGVASSEVERIVDPYYKPEIFVNLMTKLVLRTLRTTAIDLSKEQEYLHVFIACHRAMVRSDLTILRYHALGITNGEFFSSSSEDDLKNLVTNLKTTVDYIDGVIKSPIQNNIFMQVRRISAPFKVLEGVLESNRTDVRKILASESYLKDRSEYYIESFYQDLRNKLSKRISRMLIYLIITKMVLAIIIEAPFDLYLTGHINLSVLGVNALFPILLFFLIARKIRVPGKDNTIKINEYMRCTVFHDTLFPTEEDEKTFKRRLVAYGQDKGWLNYVYGILYLLVYGLIVLVLQKFGFNITSTLIFIFFISVLSFFAWNLRARSNDLQIIPKRETLVENLLNIIALPILKVGQRLSVEVSRFNFFTLIFDFILEAPFKMIVQSFEDLLDFFKTKHEEVVQN